MKTVVVYGSLKRGRYNHPLLEGSKYLGESEVVGTMYQVSSYPAMVSEGDNKYPAEVYEVDERVYQSIHDMEIGAGYREMVTTLKGEDGQVLSDVSVYYADEVLKEYCKNNCKEISSY